jgi:hypothetical protein
VAQPVSSGQPSKKRNVVLQNVSLQPVEQRALFVLASRLARGNKSALVASLIVKAAKEEIGRDWESVVMADEQEAIPA